ncbi:hypothetical protein BSM4216_0577 [Bacillus smithii]|nr:hypothetical protein BSM4216_0577 [Bacillus smithii]
MFDVYKKIIFYKLLCLTFIDLHCMITLHKFLFARNFMKKFEKGGKLV